MDFKQAPIFRMYRLKIDESDRTNFVREGTRNLLASHQNEPGTLAMYTTHADAKGTDNYVFELYQDKRQYQAHTNSTHFHNFGQLTKQVLKNREDYELNPEYLYTNDIGLTVSVPDVYSIQLTTLTIEKPVDTRLATKLHQKLLKLDTTKQGVVTQYVATVQSDPKKWLILNISNNCQLLKQIADQYRESLSPYVTSYITQQLVVDSMISQADLNFNQLSKSK